MYIVHTEASLGWGGQEIRILTEAAGMAARGHRVVLLAPPEAKIFTAAARYGVEAVALPIGRKNLAGVLALRRWLSDQPVDVINTHSSTDSWLAALAVRFRRNRPAIVRTRHISAPVRTSLPTRWLYRHACQAVVTTGEALRSDLMERLGLPADHVVSVPTGIDTERYKPADAAARLAARRALGIPDDARVIGIAATLRSWKGHDDLLAAFDVLAEKHADLHLVVAGEGPRRPRIEAAAAASPHNGRIHLLGQRDDMPTVLAALDLFVLPSYANEGVPQAILQAMAMELPVVSTTIGAIGEAVVDGETGWLVQPRVPAQLGEAIELMLSGSERAQAMGQAGRTRVMSGFSLAGMLEAMNFVFAMATRRAVAESR